MLILVYLSFSQWSSRHHKSHWDLSLHMSWRQAAPLCHHSSSHEDHGSGTFGQMEISFAVFNINIRILTCKQWWFFLLSTLWQPTFAALEQPLSYQMYFHFHNIPFLFVLWLWVHQCCTSDYEFSDDRTFLNALQRSVFKMVRSNNDATMQHNSGLTKKTFKKVTDFTP